MLFNIEHSTMQRLTPAAAKVEMKKRGHSVRSAAEHVGRSYQWINQVVNGHKASRPVLEKIFELPMRQKKGVAR